MESGSPWPAYADWTPPQWLSRHFLSDARFARAYDALGDARRALLKGLIARHYAAQPPAPATCRGAVERFDLFRHSRQSCPAPFVLLCVDASCDSPALLLAALMPALTARSPLVLVLRLGGRSAVPDALLVSCELAGQERVAALGPVLMQRLLLDCAQSGAPGVLLHPDGPAWRRLLAQPALAAALDATPLRRAALRPPLRPGLWRDTWQQLPPEDVALLYGDLAFDAAGAKPGKRSRSVTPDERAWHAFNTPDRELVLAPDARAGQGRAGLTVAECCLGQWRWPGLAPALFRLERQAFGPAD